MVGTKKYERCAKFDFKRCWLDLSPAEREEFASDAGTTSHYIQVHLTGRRRIPRKPLLERLFKACKSRKWISAKSDLVLWFHER
ncbi:hypothetical protein [Klebsiella pneumoniae]|uniref:hypothetical protein n=2 Tax=Klebsiella pneumoniae TaxID=573 RepID=UPI0022B731E9|nr:hypothetical protein [Klebsiella pneumoniae]